MAKPIKVPLITTYTRMILADWKGFAELIAKHAMTLKDTFHGDASASHKTETLTQAQIETVLAGPLQHFFMTYMSAYSLIVHVRAALHFKNDETFTNITEDEQLTKQKLDKLSSIELDTLQQSLNEQMLDHHQQLEQSVYEWSEKLVHALHDADLTLTEMEINDFFSPETLEELSKRFSDLSLDPPKTKSEQMNFYKYLQMKAQLSIQSALSRQQMPHAAADIKRVQKQLKSSFDAIAKAEKQLQEQQQAAAEQIVAKLK